jgi:catechol 2,3-dioxygenase-like lactoylglutathione lyase family enzyme
MLKDSTVMATIAVKDLDRAKQFYGEMLGLGDGEESMAGVLYKSGNGLIFIYQSSTAGTNQATNANWDVKDVHAAVDALKEKGVSFEHYDFPGAEHEGDVHVMSGAKSAWFKDPDGNILALSEMAG